MSMSKKYPVPADYALKASSESFSRYDTATVYYNGEDYIVVMQQKSTYGVEERGFNFTKTQLELLIHAAGDVLADQRRM